MSKRVSPLVVCSGLILLGLVVTAVFAPQVAPHNPTRERLIDRLLPPAWAEDGGWQYVLGTDHLGRDLLSRIIYGSRVSLVVGFTAVVIGGVLGTALGVIAGFFGGPSDEIIMALADMQLAFPTILLAIAIIAVLGPSFSNLVFVIGVSGWVTYARVARGQVLSLREKEFVEAIRAQGGSRLRIIWRHILPNTLAPLIVVATLDLARTIILESTLSFLALGIQPPTPSWGGMLSDGREYLLSAWWIATFPGLALMLTALSFNRLGDWLRDRTDPRLRRAELR
ncbi:MAG TPA: ABC transporter permease [Candidatus Tectomicrobia bacterium]|jgi:peptide/nickel transport system permease protein|nr:ABC transporter permease [Candidatus Tectomicrobia bacterium]